MFFDENEAGLTAVEVEGVPDQEERAPGSYFESTIQ